ncbi:MAG: hypothetical protein EOO40_03570 [Deltaproteobacteria bacterium]|nr:MAG: hypothetical protein EOO40_03570 [Deltaproteobacteria bacterium]
MMSDKVQESIAQALQQLQNERARIEGAIAKLEGCLEHLVTSTTGQLRDRKHSAATLERLTASPSPQQHGRSRAGWTPAARQAAATRMQSYWERRRQAQHIGEAPARRKRLDPPSSGTTGARRERSVSGWTTEKREAARVELGDLQACHLAVATAKVPSPSLRRPTHRLN